MGKIIFVHPDLGIGGAERLVLDAAIALKKKQHQVCFYTNHHDPSHCFEETVDGSLSIHVVGSWIPRSFLGRFRALFAYLRFAYLALYLAYFVLPKEKPDVVFCDLISICVPLLKLSSARFKIVFYCHYPDKLLTERKTLLKKIYRAPIDWVEEFSMGKADKILVNSKFTAGVFKNSFTSITITPEVCYPSINTDYFDSTVPKLIRDVIEISEEAFLLLSINRYERKKNLQLALRTMCELRKILSDEHWNHVHLVMAGGYDPNNVENIEHYEELSQLCSDLDLKEKVTFLKSPSDINKMSLLTYCDVVIYTPSNEHFGIVPIEAMYFGKPVIAVNSGGPTETLVDKHNGYLCEMNEKDFAKSVKMLIIDPDLKIKMGQSGKQRFKYNFSFDAFTTQLNETMFGEKDCSQNISNKKNK